MRANLIVMVIFTVLSGLSHSLPVRAQDSAAQTVEKTYCASATGYTDVDELKAALLASAKREAANEMFGELIAAFTSVENSVVISDQIRTTSVGFVRIQGDPEYVNGQALGDACVTVRAYVTAEDRAKFDPVSINKRHCITKTDMLPKQIRELARQEAQVQALIDYDRGLSQFAPEVILPLLKQVEYVESGFVQDTDTYCVQLKGYVVPIEATVLQDPTSQPSGATNSPLSSEKGSTQSGNAATDPWTTAFAVGILTFALVGIGSAVFFVIKWIIDR